MMSFGAITKFLFVTSLAAAAFMPGDAMARSVSGHGPPDTRTKAPTVCEAKPLVCSTGVYATVGQACSCTDARGQAHRGMVMWKYR